MPQFVRTNKNRDSAVPRLVVLFNLKSDADRQAYEAWARSTDLPTVKGLDSVDDFTLFRCTSQLDGSPPPYAYLEIIDINDRDRFGQEIASAAVQRVASQFQGFADDPLFIMTEQTA